jgi:hypothetical protein
MADEYQEKTERFCSVGGASAAIRAVASDAESSVAYSRTAVGFGGEVGRHVRDSPDG